MMVMYGKAILRAVEPAAERGWDVEMLVVEVGEDVDDDEVADDEVADEEVVDEELLELLKLLVVELLEVELL